MCRTTTCFAERRSSLTADDLSLAPIRIGPYNYTVTFDKNVINAESVTAGQTRQGQTDYDGEHILVDPTLSAGVRAEVLLHEIMHAIQNTVGIGSKERIVAHEHIYRTTPTLLAVLRDNPHLVAFLVGDGVTP